MSFTISSKLVLLPLHSGETEMLAVKNGGNQFCVNCGAIVCVFSNCWASSTFTLGFLIHFFGGAAGVAKGVLVIYI